MHIGHKLGITVRCSRRNPQNTNSITYLIPDAYNSIVGNEITSSKCPTNARMATLTHLQEGLWKKSMYDQHKSTIQYKSIITDQYD